MKISPEKLTFETLNEIQQFVREHELLGTLELSEPVKDRSGNILIQEHVVVKESAFKKLETIQDQYDAVFVVELKAALLERIGDVLAAKILQCVKTPKNEFTRFLFENTHHRFAKYVRTALRGRKTVLAVMKTARDAPEFFLHSSELGLLTLGIVMQRYLRLPFIHRYSFLAGFFADINLADSDLWRHPRSDAENRRLAARSAEFAEKFELAPAVVSAVEKHFLDAAVPSASPEKIEGEEPGASFFDEITEAEEKEAKPVPAGGDQSVVVLTEALRMARFIIDARTRLAGSKDPPREILGMLVFHAEKGYFHRDLVNPVIALFRDFEELSQRLRKVAAIEAKCPFPPSAWAYPKPRAMQVLCRNGVLECPHLQSGWDIHIVSAQDAYGWIGAPLPEGHYHKCDLEKDLQSDV